ncbi:MAG: hypothetical protein BroJett003_18980 [Planctomycetota bacterium]|nr:MAG: hypothetical protein BroJett003_18980 [Planctomycetota bacterium]
MVQGHFWSRVTNRLRGHRSGAPVEWASDPASEAPDDDAPPDDRGDGATLIVGKAAAIRSLDGLQRTQEKVVSLIESIQSHLVAQQDRTARMAEALDRLADSVSQLPRASTAQAEAITALAGQLESTAVRTRRLDNHLAQLPELIEQQRRTDARIADALGDLRGSIESLTRVETASATMAEQLCRAAGEREERILRVFADHTRRLTRVLSGAIALAVLSAVLGLVAVLM